MRTLPTQTMRKAGGQAFHSRPRMGELFSAPDITNRSSSEPSHSGMRDTSWPRQGMGQGGRRCGVDKSLCNCAGARFSHDTAWQGHTCDIEQ